MDFFKKLVSLYSEISDIYIKLCSEEIWRSNVSNSFKNLVKLLREKVNEEKILFEKLFDSDDYEEMKTIIFDEDNSTMLRMRDYIKTYEALNITIEEFDSEEIIEDKKLTMKIAKLMCSCVRNIFLVYSSFVDEFVSNNNIPELRERLLTIKYYNTFTKHDIEDVLLEYNFKVPLENYVDVYLVAETLGINISECDEAILNCYLDVIDGMINQLMEFNDSDYNDYNKLAAIANASFMLQASFALISKKDYLANKEKIYEKIEELKNGKNNKSANMIYEIINKRKICQARVKKVSMRPFIG
ncbi:MAG: hypothetical protein IJE89_00870 [Bacilli bacterium]|nr:hypothetical protein [Bacilli bacterium]